MDLKKAAVRSAFFVTIAIVALSLVIGITSAPSSSSRRLITLVRAEALFNAFSDYSARTGYVPSEDTADVIHELRRNGYLTQTNSQVKFLFLFWRDVPLFDEKGQYLDGWGTPFTIQSNPSSGSISVVSFGKNRKYDNAEMDDVVFGAPVH